MKAASSLRNRLLALILAPMIIVAVVATEVRYLLAQQTSSELYDNTLLAVATTISRDIAISQGDVLAQNLVDLLAESLGDKFYYNYTAPESAFVTGYSSPPRPPGDLVDEGPLFYDAEFLGQPVRVVMMREVTYDTSPDQLATITVWQTINQREQLSLELAQGAAVLLAILVTVGGVVVWFGVNIGLRPLLELRDSVKRRSSKDLTPITKQVPREVVDLVGELNNLFGRLAAAFAARDVFIANAAHQLRNPIAGLLAQAQAVEGAADESERRSRAAEVTEAARRASRLTTQLLSMEKLHADPAVEVNEKIDLASLIEETARSLAPSLMRRGVDISFEINGDRRTVIGDPLLMTEALENLIDNAVKYGRQEGGEIEVALDFRSDHVVLSVSDNGPGVPSSERETVFERFQRGREDIAGGAGLGLSIVREIAVRHGGHAKATDSPSGARFEISFPYAHVERRSNGDGRLA